MNFKRTIFLAGIMFLSTGSLHASYFARLAACSQQIVKIAQGKVTQLATKFEAQNLKNFKAQIEESLKDTVQQAEVIEPMIKDVSKDASRKSIHMTKSGLFGKAESVVVENVQINNIGPKSFSDCFFEWLKTGGQTRAHADIDRHQLAGGHP